MALSWISSILHLQVRFVSHEVAGPGTVSTPAKLLAESVATVGPPLMPREGVSHDMLLGFEKHDHSLLARSKGKPQHFRDVAVALA